MWVLAVPIPYTGGAYLVSHAPAPVRLFIEANIHAEKCTHIETTVKYNRITRCPLVPFQTFLLAVQHEHTISLTQI